MKHTQFSESTITLYLYVRSFFLKKTRSQLIIHGKRDTFAKTMSLTKNYYNYINKGVIITYLL